MYSIVVRGGIAADDENKQVGDPTGKIRFRTNCVDKVVVEIQVWKWSMRTRKWSTEWIDASQYDVMVTDTPPEGGDQKVS